MKTPIPSIANSARPASCVPRLTVSSRWKSPAVDQAIAASATKSRPRRVSPCLTRGSLVSACGALCRTRERAQAARAAGGPAGPHDLRGRRGSDRDCRGDDHRPAAVRPRARARVRERRARRRCSRRWPRTMSSPRCSCAWAATRSASSRASGLSPPRSARASSRAGTRRAAPRQTASAAGATSRSGRCSTPRPRPQPACSSRTATGSSTSRSAVIVPLPGASSSGSRGSSRKPLPRFFDRCGSEAARARPASVRALCGRAH